MRIRAILSFVILIAAVIFIPARIGSMGYFPPDDAGRHVAKAISGKPWHQILVMRDDITTDTHHGWDNLLGFLHRKFHVNGYGLVAFSVTFCFMLIAGLPLFFFRRPEAWLLTLLSIILFDPNSFSRFFLGRPYIVSCAVYACICLSWKFFAGEKNDWPRMAALTLVMAVTAWLVPSSSYLFFFPLLGFACARQWRALVRLAACMAAGCFAGYLLTGYPLRLAHDIFFMVSHGPDQTVLSRMLVTEFQPTHGNLLVFIIMAAIILVRVLRKEWHRGILDNPIFINAIAGAVFGHIVGRFWHDWGLIAALAWIASQADDLLAAHFPFDSMKRLVLSASAALCLFIVLTADVQSRWTWMVPSYPLVYDKAAAEQKPWFPDSGGILYSDDMGIFFKTFFHNPHAPWRYVLGYEPELMRPEDLKVYRDIERSNRGIDSYKPWIDKMRRADRMVFISEAQPRLSALEWSCVNRNTWLGRLPRKTETLRDTNAGRKY